METNMIGNKIAEARKKINISQAQLAQRVFVSPQAVGKWERGESLPDILTLNRLAEILGVDLNYFSDGAEPAATEIKPVEPLVKQPAELPSGKQEKKLNWDMSLGNWVDADFSGLKNLHEKFSSSNMQRCKFIGSDLSGILLKSNNVDNCDFSHSEISGSNMQSSYLINNVFKDSSLKETEFLKSYIKDCDFSGADFSETEFSKSYISGCDFTEADFTGTEFSKSYISGCNFTGTDFTGMVFKSGGFSGVVIKSGDSEKNMIADAVWNRASFIDTQVADIVFAGTLDDCYFENCAFTRVTFQHATLINTFFKNNKSLKRIKFIDCQVDRMTHAFLKNGKADLTGVTLLTS